MSRDQAVQLLAQKLKTEKVTVHELMGYERTYGWNAAELLRDAKELSNAPADS